MTAPFYPKSEQEVIVEMNSAMTNMTTDLSTVNALVKYINSDSCDSDIAKEAFDRFALDEMAVILGSTRSLHQGDTHWQEMLCNLQNRVSATLNGPNQTQSVFIARQFLQFLATNAN